MFQPQLASSPSILASGGLTAAPVPWVSSASMYCQFRPKPRDKRSFTRQPRAGLTLTVFRSDLMAWTWPAQVSSYSVVRPKGAFTPRPNLRSGVTSMA